MANGVSVSPVMGSVASFQFSHKSMQNDLLNNFLVCRLDFIDLKN